MKFLFTLSFICAHFLSSAQCCPYVNNVEVIPTVPTISDNIKIVTTVTTANQGQFIFSDHSVLGNTIEIEACYYNGVLTATQTYYDTLDIGILPVGIYTINFTAYESSDINCNYTDSSSTSPSMTVLEQTNSLGTLSEETFNIFPNPSSGTFSIQQSEGMKASQIRIFTLSGKVVHEGIFTKNMILDLQSGTYFVELLEDDSVIGHRRLVIQ